MVVKKEVWVFYRILITADIHFSIGSGGVLVKIRCCYVILFWKVISKWRMQTKKFVWELRCVLNTLLQPPENNFYENKIKVGRGDILQRNRKIICMGFIDAMTLKY
jgi:hypothetical protein